MAFTQPHTSKSGGISIILDAPWLSATPTALIASAQGPLFSSFERRPWLDTAGQETQPENPPHSASQLMAGLVA